MYCKREKTQTVHYNQKRASRWLNCDIQTCSALRYWHCIATRHNTGKSRDCANISNMQYVFCLQFRWKNQWMMPFMFVGLNDGIKCIPMFCDVPIMVYFCAHRAWSEGRSSWYESRQTKKECWRNARKLSFIANADGTCFVNQETMQRNAASPMEAEKYVYGVQLTWPNK